MCSVRRSAAERAREGKYPSFRVRCPYASHTAVNVVGAGPLLASSAASEYGWTVPTSRIRGLRERAAGRELLAGPSKRGPPSSCL
jgi:transposase